MNTSRRWITRWALLLGLFLCGPLRADTIQGYVLHAATQQRLAGVEVDFLIAAEDGSMSPMTSTTTDEEGRFDFSGPFLTTGAPFALEAKYEDVEYPSSVLRVGDQDQIIIEVYDTGSDASKLRITSHSIFLGLVGQTLEAAHLVQADNSGNETYLGPLVEGRRRGLEFVVPAELGSLTPHTGELVRLSATRVFDTQPLPPGPSQVAFTFQVRPEAFDGHFVHEVLYPTQRLDLFIQPLGVTLGPPFEDLGVIDLHSQQYRHYRAHDLVPGQRLEVELPIERSLRWALKWALLALVPAVLIGITAMTRRPTHAPPAPAVSSADPSTRATSQDTSREQILQQLSHLRALRAKARGQEAVRLDRQYQELMSRARDIYRQLPSA